MDISIIIVNYNTKNDLRNCIQSLLKALSGKQLDYEIFVVDNNSTDGSKKVIKKEFPSVNLIENQENLGFAKANNQAIRVTKGNYIFLLNPDTIILEKSLDSMIEFMEKNPKIGILTPKLLNAKGEVWLFTEGVPNPFTVFLRFCVPRIFLSPKIKKFVAKSKLKKLLGTQINSYFSTLNLNSPIDINVAPGACLLVRRKMIKKVGLLDEKFFLYSEDTDWCFRTKKAGWRIVYFPKAKIIHYGGTSTAGEHSLLSFCWRAQSAYYYFKKHYNKKTAFEVKLLLFFVLIIKMPQFVFHYFFKNQNKDSNLLKIYWITLKKITTGKI